MSDPVPSSAANPGPDGVPPAGAGTDAAAYTLVRLRNGAASVRAAAYGEVMHPGVGPGAEAEALYVRQTDLAGRLSRRPEGPGAGAEPFVVWDVGLGAAANALAVLGCARAQERPGRLRLLSFDDTDGPLRFALGQASDLPYLAGWEAAVGGLLERRRVSVMAGSWAIDWELVVADFPSLLAGPEAEAWPKPDLILYDPFSPAKNPAMWTLPVFARLHALLDPARPCLVPTYSRSTLLRVTLLLAGFWVGAGEASGMKEETTMAANDPALVPRLLDGRWLERARRSDSAEPLTGALYRRAPLSAETWERLQAHPQFRRG